MLQTPPDTHQTISDRLAVVLCIINGDVHRQTDRNLAEILKFGRSSEIWSKFWNLVKVLKFGQSFWNLVEVLKFGRNSEILLKIWDLRSEIWYLRSEIRSVTKRQLETARLSYDTEGRVVGVVLYTPPKFSENLKFFENLKNFWKSEKFSKIWKVSKNLKSFRKSEKFLKIWKVSKNMKIWKWLGHLSSSLWSHVSRVASLSECPLVVAVSQWVSEWRGNL